MSTHARHLTTTEGHDDQARLRRCSTGALAASALAGSVAWATIPDSGGVIQGCYKNGGNLKVVSELPCPKGYTSLPWNQQGPKGDPGTDGVSPAVTRLSQGDANCPSGGAALMDASGSTAYVCNGAAGADGQSFAGTFTSPNGDYSINVSDAGITIAHGGSNSITLTGDDLTLRSDDIDMRSRNHGDVRLNRKSVAHHERNGLFRASGPLNLQGSVINMN